MDDKSDPATAVSVATKLITQDNVVALLGPLSTPAALAVQPLAEKYGVPEIRWDTPTLDSPATSAQVVVHRQRGSGGRSRRSRKADRGMGWKKIVAAADILPPNFQALQILQKDAASKGFTINYPQGHVAARRHRPHAADQQDLCRLQSRQAQTFCS